jgi:hypothetical protein
LALPALSAGPARIIAKNFEFVNYF